MADEQWRLCCLLAGKEDGQMLGQTEFEMRDRLLRMGARAIEKAINDRRKKGATTVVALPAPIANITPAPSNGDEREL